MISRPDALNNSNLLTNCRICARHVGAMAKTESSTPIVYAVRICIDFIKDDTAGCLLCKNSGAIQNWPSHPPRRVRRLIVIAAIVTCASPFHYSNGFLSCIALLHALSVAPSSRSHPWTIILVAAQPVLWFYDPLSMGLSVFKWP